MSHSKGEDKQMRRERWKHYLPAGGLFGMALFFGLFPSFTLFLIVGGLSSLAVLYAWIIYRIHRYQDQDQFDTMTGFERDIFDTGEPTFRNISVTFIRRRRWDQSFNEQSE